MSFPLALLVSGFSGFIALSYEIIWFRAYSFVSQSSPQAFGLLLGAYLLGLAVGSLISNGVLDRFPGLQIILSHGGGGVPYLVGRFDCMHRRADHKAQGIVAHAAPSTYLRRFHFDTILHAPAPLKYLADVVGTDRLVLGTDYPFPPRDDDPVGSVHAIGLAGADLDRVLRGNAAALFGL